MKKEEMNRVLGMLDDDVIADALGEKKTAGRAVVGRRKLAVALIAATLAVAILASTLIIALGRNTTDERVNLLPPVGMTVIKNVTSSAQITGDTASRPDTYPTVASSEYWSVEPIPYVTAGGLELSDSLYEALVKSNDANRTWSIEVSISPNLYITKDYLELQMESMLSEVTANHLETLVGLYEQAKDNFDIDALYEQYKDLFELEDLYKYFKSGELDRDLLNADVEAMTEKAREILDRCGEIREDFWSELEPIVLSEFEKLGVPFVKDGDSYVIFVTEGELLSLAGIEGLKFDNAYYNIDVNEFNPNIVCERAGKKITKKLADAFEENAGKNVLFAVLVESADVAEMGDKSAYEQEYLEHFRVYSSSKVTKAALESAVEGGEKLANAIEICGEETVNKYIKDGVFDSALFDSDIAALGAKIDEMRTNLYGDDSAEVYDAFKDKVNYIEITAQGSVVIYVTAAEFDALTTTGDFVYNLSA